MRRSGPALLCALFLCLLAGCINSEDKKPLPENVAGTTPTTKTATTTTTAPTTAGDPVAGKQVFMSAGCTSCHTLADAGAKGTVGPNLDEAKPSSELVVERVTNGKAVMPSFKDQLSEKQIQDVAAYVAKATSG
jgi:cytochrome c6